MNSMKIQLNYLPLLANEFYSIAYDCYEGIRFSIIEHNGIAFDNIEFYGIDVYPWKSL
jgi:hypothetical protein